MAKYTIQVKAYVQVSREIEADSLADAIEHAGDYLDDIKPMGFKVPKPWDKDDWGAEVTGVFS